MNVQQLAEIKERAEKADYHEMTLDENGIALISPQGVEVHHFDTADSELDNFLQYSVQDVKCLVAEVEQLREALEFYADREQYAERMEANKGLCMYRPIMRDKGKTAQQALREGNNA